MSIRFISFLLVAIFILPFCNFAQSVNYLDSKSFEKTRDSLILYKKSFLTEQQKLKKEIDSLKNISDELDEKISTTLEEINSLYKKKFGKEKANRIINKQIWKGMTEKMLRASWGIPDKIEKNVEKWGVFTQWYFGDVTFFFKNGKLTDWEEIKK